jgi:hypothetical protein
VLELAGAGQHGRDDREEPHRLCGCAGDGGQVQRLVRVDRDPHGGEPDDRGDGDGESGHDPGGSQGAQLERFGGQ